MQKKFGMRHTKNIYQNVKIQLLMRSKLLGKIFVMNNYNKKV